MNEFINSRDARTPPPPQVRSHTLFRFGSSNEATAGGLPARSARSARGYRSCTLPERGWQSCVVLKGELPQLARKGATPVA